MKTFWTIADETKTKTKIKTRDKNEIEINGILVLSPDDIDENIWSKFGKIMRATWEDS